MTVFSTFLHAVLFRSQPLLANLFKVFTATALLVKASVHSTKYDTKVEKALFSTAKIYLVSLSFSLLLTQRVKISSPDFKTMPFGLLHKASC